MARNNTPVDKNSREYLLRQVANGRYSLLLIVINADKEAVAKAVVAAAGCVLPLSDSNRLSSDLGTRHRAGVGMSEASDAVVVIVSEETGTISVAVGGMLKRHLAPQTLDKLLHNELCPANDEDEKQDLSLRLKQKLQPRRKETDDNEK